MTQTRNLRTICDLEQAILIALCSDSMAADVRGKILARLTSHQWREAEHRIVYEALQRAGARDGAGIQERLPGHATRVGFPDVNWQLYFAVETVAKMNVFHVVQELFRMTGAK